MTNEIIFSCLIIAAYLYVDFLVYKVLSDRKGLIQTLIVKYKAKIKTIFKVS